MSQLVAHIDAEEIGEDADGYKLFKLPLTIAIQQRNGSPDPATNQYRYFTIDKTGKLISQE
jgi:hypothetical protein